MMVALFFSIEKTAKGKQLHPADGSHSHKAVVVGGKYFLKK